jgi:osmoprotectant transport system ATP-binding protein
MIVLPLRIARPCEKANLSCWHKLTIPANSWPMTSPAPLLRFDGVTCRFGAIVAVDAVSCAIAAGSFVALVGASGSGKSTLLKTVNTLVAPSAGRVLFVDEDVSTLQPAALRRRVGYVFQGVGLFPHFSVSENIAIGPRLAGEKLSPQRIAELLALVELDPAFASRMPDELSGGQRQRVGVARALAGEPELLLMDEPFGALDPVTRSGLGAKVRELHERLGLTTVMVTHDMAEALLLADRVLVMDAGLIVADETPHALLAGRGGDVAQGLVAVPRDQAERLAAMEART